MKQWLICIVLAVLMFAVFLYVTDDPNSAEYWGDFRLDRRYMGKPCDAWAIDRDPVDMQELNSAMSEANPGDTIFLGDGGKVITVISSEEMDNIKIEDCASYMNEKLKG